MADSCQALRPYFRSLAKLALSGKLKKVDKTATWPVTFEEEFDRAWNELCQTHITARLNAVKDALLIYAAAGTTYTINGGTAAPGDWVQPFANTNTQVTVAIGDAPIT